MAGTATALRQGSSSYSTPNSYGSAQVNGQLVGFQTSAGYKPTNYGGGISAVPALSPVTVPPNVGYGMFSPNNGSLAPANSTTGKQAYQGGIKGSPALWALGLVTFGLLWMRFVHWRKGGSQS